MADTKDGSELSSDEIQRILSSHMREGTQVIPPGIMGMPMRQTARSALVFEIDRLRKKAHDLEALLKILPQEMEPNADQALWSLLMDAFRHG